MTGANNRKVIQDHLLLFTDDLDAFSHYPWGYMLWNATTDSMR